MAATSSGPQAHAQRRFGDLTNLTKQISTLGLYQGPNAPAVLGQLTDHDLSHEGSPYSSYLPVTIAGVECHLFRISYVGDTGWESICRGTRRAPSSARMEAGKDHGLRITGSGVYSLSGRIEKGYRLMGAELESEYNPIEAARPSEGEGRGLHRQGGLPGRP